MPQPSGGWNGQKCPNAVRRLALRVPEPSGGRFQEQGRESSKVCRESRLSFTRARPALVRSRPLDGFLLCQSRHNRNDGVFEDSTRIEIGFGERLVSHAVGL